MRNSRRRSEMRMKMQELENKDWAEISSVISKYRGEWDAPETRVVTPNMTSGAILGNGDLAAVLGGDEDALAFYLAKADFWSAAKTIYSDGGPKPLGGIRIGNPAGGTAKIPYHLVQDILNARLDCVQRFSGNPIRSRSWVAPDENVLVIEMRGMGERDVPVTAEVWAFTETGHPVDAGCGEGMAWVTKRTPRLTDWACFGAIAVKPLGGTSVVVSRKDACTSVLSFTVPAGKTAYLIGTVTGGREAALALPEALELLQGADSALIARLDRERARWWRDYWEKEYVILGDEELEEYYYGSLYQMGAASRAGKEAPGLFGPWITSSEPAWGGDYTLDYNYYCPFNGMASSNRLEQMAGMFQPILAFMDAGRVRASKKKRVNGKAFPEGLPGVQYPAHIGPWGMETYFDCGLQSNAVFAAIPFIWYYRYTLNREFLKNTAYPYLREVADFWDSYLQKDGKGRYVVYESSARESWSGSHDTNPCVDLAFLKNLYANLLPMSETLGVDEGRRAKWRDILEHLSPLPTTDYMGLTVFRECENRPEISTDGPGDNPVNMLSIYPGGNVGLDSDPQLLQTARNSLKVMSSWDQGNAFANIFVMAARVGWPAEDLMERMKKRIRKIRQPNLTYQSDGHGLEGVGALEAVNSMLLQSQEGILRLFPVWPKGHDAKFKNMRAMGAFLVDGEIRNDSVQDVSIFSEKGSVCVIENPWKGDILQVTSQQGPVETKQSGDRYSFRTEKGERYLVRREKA